MAVLENLNFTKALVLFLLSNFCDLLFPNFIIHFLQQPPRSSPPFSVMIPPLPRAPISPPPIMSMLTTTVTSSKSPKGSSGFSIDNIIGNERTKENSSSSPTPIQVRNHFLILKKTHSDFKKQRFHEIKTLKFAVLDREI